MHILFAYISEPVELSNGMSLTTTTVKPYFNLTKLVGSTWTAVDFNVEFIGNDKQRLMFTPLDPNAPAVNTTSNVHMVDDTQYRLMLVNPSTWQTLQDAAGNAVVLDTTIFRTEDITCPVTTSHTVSSITAQGFTLEVQLNEKGVVDYRVVTKGAANTAANAKASGSAATNASGYVKFTVTGINANTANGYDYDIYILKKDDEVDRLATDAAILQEWPYTITPSWGLQTIRIKDLNPSPNQCSLGKTLHHTKTV
jgi:hypothetical protein